MTEKNWKNRITGHGEESPDQLLANPHNHRIHPKRQQDALGGSLDTLGYIQTVIVNRATGHIVDGHLRVTMALREGQKSIPVTYVELTAEEEAQALLSLDPIAAMAATDKDKVDELLRMVNTDNEQVMKHLTDFAAENKLEWGQPEQVDAEPQTDRAAELQEKWQTATGQLWKLGEHRLLIGDCTVRENVERLMGGESADLLFTSPPYGNQRDYTEEATESLKDWDALMINTFSNPILNENAQIIVNLGLIHKENEWMPYYDNWIEWMRSQGWRRFGLYVWDSGFGLMGNWNGRLAPSFEFVFHFNKTSKQPNKIIEKKKESVQIKKGDGLRKKDGSIGKLSNPEASLQTHKIPDSVIRIFRSTETIRQFHPAVFSLEFAEFNINTWTIEGNLTYEPFAGSGTTIIAAHNLNRRCYAVEISEKYGAVILERFATATGIMPELLNQGSQK